MSYYHLPSTTERSPGFEEVKLSDGAKLSPPRTGWTPTLAALCGFVVVVNTTPTGATQSQTYDRSLSVVGQTVTEVWTIRAKNAGELASDSRQAVVADIESRVNAYITASQTYLAIGSPSAAQVAAQTTRNTRAIIGIIRQARSALQVTNTDT